VTNRQLSGVKPRSPRADSYRPCFIRGLAAAHDRTAAAAASLLTAHRETSDSREERRVPMVQAGVGRGDPFAIFAICVAVCSGRTPRVRPKADQH